MQPLTKEARDLYHANKNTLDKANKGLLFERFFDGYLPDFTVEQGNNAEDLSTLVGACGNSQELADAATRRVQLTSSLGGEFGVFKTDWHFVSGMGNAHPVENGFTWHPVYGTPYLPGSSVKGLLRAWMEVWANAEQAEEDRTHLIHAWFGRSAGTDGKGDAGKVGDLIFLDALPIESPRVSVDIMTPHMGKWYEQGGDRITEESQPGDWHNPVPVPFLVASDARFVFSIVPRTPEAQKEGLAEEAMEHLKDALAWLGAGAKTAAGYGHMTFDEEDTLLRFKSAEEREAIERAKAEKEQKEREAIERAKAEKEQKEQIERLADAGIAMGVETWEKVRISATNPGAGELTVERELEDGKKESASGKFFSQLTKSTKDKAKKKKAFVDVDIDRQGNRITITAIREIED